MPPPALREQLELAMRLHPAPTRAEMQRREWRIWMAGVAAMVVTFLVFGGVTPGGRSASFLVASSLGWIVCAAFGMWAVFTRRRSGLGLPSHVLVGGALATAPLTWLGFVAVSEGFGNDHPFGTSWRGTVACLIATLVLGTGPFVAGLLAKRRSDPVHPRATGAAIGATAGAFAGVMIGLHCPAGAYAHVGMGHAAAALILGVAGWVLGGPALALRASR